MPLSRRSQRNLNIWPGFVDALATLLLALIFVLMVLVLAQFFLSGAISGKDTALEHLRAELGEMAARLSLERRTGDELRADMALLSGELQASVAARDDLADKVRGLESDLGLKERAIAADRDQIRTQIEELDRLAREVSALKALKGDLEASVKTLAGKVETTEAALGEERNISDSARAQAALLNQQIAALRSQIEALSGALGASEKLAQEQNVRIDTLGQRLNAALAGKVQELSRYRSEFFGRLRELLGDQKDVRVVGDRFVFQSEVLFESASAELGEAGKAQLIRLAQSVREIASRIPSDIAWILRIDGHTDTVPIYNWRYPSNWELSAARAISVVKFLSEQGVPVDHLAAAGFGAHHPLDAGTDDNARRRNRRIELKLTER